MDKPTFVVYVDESGDEGFRFGAGSSDWFVLSAVIVRKSTDLETVKLVDDVRVRLGRPARKPLHFRDLKHEHRLPFVDRIAGASLRTISVLVHKPSLKEPEIFQTRSRLYFYSVRFLLERVSWYCRDSRKDAGDGSAEIVFSNRAGMSYEELRGYLNWLRLAGFDVRIHWPVIKTDQITSHTPGRRMGLQIVDAVASSFFSAIEPSSHGYTEDRYARMLKPVVYHRYGRYRGYGLKFWPKETDAMIREDPVLEWVRSDYPQ